MSTTDTFDDTDDTHWHTDRQELERIADEYDDEPFGEIAQLLLDSREETN